MRAYMRSKEKNPIKCVRVEHHNADNAADDGSFAVVTVTIYEEAVVDYVLFVEYRTIEEQDRWALLAVVMGERIFEVHNLTAKHPYQLRLSYSIAWKALCGEAVLSEWINTTLDQQLDNSTGFVKSRRGIYLSAI
ncbi:hypothetical protein Tcan_04283 [Toxocara canis]|uniref:Uncharacterized protein n=1 Tax=Toxocara canis TaxID=6265 RepID=A0A0B2VMR1_TOXCA|nr:hypothetical protein Tcan_04283 [Toxocara canis]